MKQMFKSFIDRAVPDRYLLTRVSGPDAGVVLTFDDGPDPEWTPRSLDALSEMGVKATYFLVGENAERHPDIVRRIVAEGHTVGDHSYSHRDLSKLNGAQLEQEVIDNLQVLSEISGQDVRLSRPPWGKIGLRSAAYLVRRGVRIVMWSLDSTDYRKSGTNDILERIQHVGLKPGDIILLHDDNEFTIEALPQIIEAVRAQGLEFGNLDN